ncbi:sensor histidine kinase [Campylobacter sp.]|uniref:sensor histidine kinase n=1 Tax=Campylobacter sp. TaxID=205 RepID=UPI0026F7DD6B|nr:sensor histidine kinase [Campylobacter sp.]
MAGNFYKNRIFIVFSVIFLSLMAGNYSLNRSFTKEILINEQLSILKSSSNRIEKWLDNKKSSLTAINSLISKFDSKLDEQIIQDILEKSQEIAKFSSVYAGYENHITISSRVFNKPPNYDPTHRPWYRNTISNDKIYITKPYIDVGLKVPVISICQSIKHENSPKGVLCGILSFNDIKSEILNLKFENGGFIFLMDENLNILLHPDEIFELKRAEFDIENLDLSFTSNHETPSEILTFRPLPNSQLILVAKSFKKDIYTKINEQFIVNFAIYIISIFLFLILAYFYNKRSSRQDKLLEKTNKMLELFANNSSKGILITNDKNEAIFSNKKLGNILNLEPKTYGYDELIEIFPIQTAQKIKNFIAKKSSKKPYIELHYELNKKHFQIQLYLIFTQEQSYEGMILFLANVSQKHKFNEFKKEHERMLFQQTKMAELGQMIAAISHQWIQPLNSLGIFLGNLVQFKKLNKLSDEIFYDNIQRSLANIDYMVNTMDIFKNFYKLETKAQIFDVKKAIEDTIFILFAQKSKINIKITIKSGVNLTCENYQNEFKQIIACLIQNSKQALLESKNKRRARIVIAIKESANQFEIRVIDNAEGILKQQKDKIFAPFSSTKNSSGLGLYISKLIANRKCQGDLYLLKDKNPTIFMLKIAKKVR